MKRKRYTEDLEFKISDDDDDGDNSNGPKSPSNASEQQVGSNPDHTPYIYTLFLERTSSLFLLFNWYYSLFFLYVFMYE